MKLKTELEITPEEALKLFQQPQYNWWQEAIDWNIKHNPIAAAMMGISENEEKKE